MTRTAAQGMGVQIYDRDTRQPITPAEARQQALDSARNAMKFLADFGANHLVVFSPSRTRPGADTPAAFAALAPRIGRGGPRRGARRRGRLGCGN